MQPLTDAELEITNQGWIDFGKRFPEVSIQQAEMAEEFAKNHEAMAAEHYEFARNERARAQALRKGAAQA